MSSALGGRPREPQADCPLCPRLASFRAANREAHPEWFNAPVPTFASPGAALLVVGLAPGLRGANRTGRPFTGDFAGDLLYETLLSLGLARGVYRADPGDGMTLVRCAITNAVRCVPPQNKPLPAEITTCRPFLSQHLAALPREATVVALGRIAHDSIVRAAGARLAAHPFGHGNRHHIVMSAGARTLALFDSYHCSRYNTNTGLLTPAMFMAVLSAARDDMLSRTANAP